MNTIGYGVTKFNGTLTFKNDAGLVNFVADNSEQLLGFIELGANGNIEKLKINGTLITDSPDNTSNGE